MTRTYPLPLINADWCDVDVNGEYYHRNEIRKAAIAAGPGVNGEYRFRVSLVCEPDNPYSTSGKAISVRNGVDVLGYIPKELAEKYYPEIARVCASGMVPETAGRLWVSGDLFSSDPKMYLSVALLDPGLNAPLNDPPADGWALIPYGKTIQVTKEADHFDVLEDFVPETGRGRLLVSLHREKLGVKTPQIGVEVRLDGQRIGELTKASSEKLLPAIEHFENQGFDSVCYATIQGSSVAAEVTLNVLRANEMDEDALNPTASPLARLVPFEIDSSDYDVPAAYIPRDTEPEKQTPKQSSGSSMVAAFVQPSVEQSIPWEDLLVADATPRATPFQRGYVRGRIGRHLANKKAPRMDYLTVGQAVRVLEFFDEPVSPLTKGGRGSKGLWWFLVVVLCLLAFICLFIPGIGQAISLLIVGSFAYHLWTRRNLEPPFNQR
ncbi:hypothetical protein M3G73_07195 [Corynebacterium sanguinis]|uniref:hypothetical protein n=1 Tax=Corynebacterium sanguinis TaxID=2594913 RepID=UPI0021A57DB2|nr:hypothetical protein [Corynebacterium sanguinis]MCT2329980.1 hypothetical protein [Corynebacterium sanguinis]